MNSRTKLCHGALWSIVGLAVAVPAARANQVYVTDFAKNNNIYTNLNQQFPNTGPGIPGSTIGTPNASFLFNPDPTAIAAAGYAPGYVAGSNLVNNGINFDLVSDTVGRDFAEIADGTSLVVSPTNVDKASSLYLIMGAYNGISVNVNLTGMDGHQQSFSNVPLLDFYNSSTVDNVGPSASDQTLFQVDDRGAAATGNSATGYTGIYDITELSFKLDPILASEPLTGISIDAFDGNKALLYGITASVAAVPLPPAIWGGLALIGAVAVGNRLGRRRMA